MSKTISKYIGEGFGRGELYAALAYDESDTFGGMKIKGVSFSPVAGKPAINIGDSTTAWTALYTDRAISIYSTCASVNASTTAMPVYIKAIYTGAGQVGRVAEFKLETNVAMGGWMNAIKGYTEFTGTSGRTTGLASAINAEIKLPNATLVSGVYACLELEWIGQTSTNTIGGTTVYTTLMYANVAGGVATDFDSRGYLFSLQGMTSGTTKALYGNTLKCLIGTTVWYLPLSSAEGSYTTAYPIVTSYNGNPSVSIGSSGTPLTTATTAYSALKCWSNYSLGTAGTYHVGAWFISMYTATATWGGSVFALRGSAGVSATETTVNTAGQIIGVHGRILSDGTLYNAGVIYAGVLGQICIGGTWTAANKVAAGWFDWQLNTQVAAGDTTILYLSNNANSATANLNPTNVMYIYAPYMTNFFNLNAATNGGMVGDLVTANPTIATYRKIRVTIDGATLYLLACTI